MKGEPLAGLDDVDWSRLEHAYGKATDVPTRLRTFAADDAQRARIASDLEGSLCHQGTPYPATVAAVPFLYALASDPSVGQRHLLLRLLADVATAGDHLPLVLDGIPEPKRWPKKRNDLVNAFLAVRDGAPAALPLLADPDPRLRSAAAFLLAWTAKHAADAASRVAAAIAAEREPLVRATLALSLGFLARYLGTSDHDSALRAARDDVDPHVRAAGALALATAHAGAGDAEDRAAIADGAASLRPADRDLLPFGDGDLAEVAVRVLAAIAPRIAGGMELLVDVMERGGGAARFAANVAVRRLFEGAPAPPPAPVIRGRYADREAALLAAVTTRREALTPLQERVLRALADRDEPWDGDLGPGLREHGLPSSRHLLRRWLGEPAPASRLDETVEHEGSIVTLADLVARLATRGTAQRAEAARLLVETLGSPRVGALAVEVVTEMTGPGMMDVAIELAVAAGPGAEAELLAMARGFERDGPPTREAPEGGTITFTTALVVVGIGLAFAALARGGAPSLLVDDLLQRVHGFVPRVRDALAALPADRRDAWLLDPARDDRTQPAEHFTGSWAYWAPYPSPAITAVVLQRVPTWKKKDAWGTPRKVGADPLLLAYAASLRAMGNEADARRCEDALARLR